MPEAVSEALPETDQPAPPVGIGFLHGIPTELIEDVWPVVSHLLAPLWPLLSSQYTPDSMKAALLDGRMALTVFSSDGCIQAALIYETLVFPEGRFLSLVAVAGGGFDLWPAWFERAKQVAIETGHCRIVIPCGRPGWKRVLADVGLEEVGRVYMTHDLRKELH